MRPLVVLSALVLLPGAALAAPDTEVSCALFAPLERVCTLPVRYTSMPIVLCEGGSGFTGVLTVNASAGASRYVSLTCNYVGGVMMGGVLVVEGDWGASQSGLFRGRADPLFSTGVPVGEWTVRAIFD